MKIQRESCVMQDANFAAKAMMSFNNLGSQENWPASYSDHPVKHTLEQLSNENTFLRQQLASRADTKFVQGILQKSVANVQVVQVGSNADVADHCTRLESERLYLKREVYQLKLMLNSTYPGAMTVKFYEDQLAADVRLREYQTIQHNDVHAKLDENSAEMHVLSGDISKLAKQNDLLLSLIDSKLSVSKQVSNRHAVAQPVTHAELFVFAEWQCHFSNLCRLGCFCSIISTNVAVACSPQKCWLFAGITSR